MKQLVEKIKTFFNSDRNARFKFADKYCGTNYKVLDIGCGDNPFKSKSKFKIKSISMDKDLKVQSDTHNLFDSPEIWNNRFFDLIVMIDVLEHLTDVEREQYLRYVKILLSDKGHLIKTTPNTNYLKAYSEFWDTPEHKFPISKRGIISLLNDCGFEIVEIRGVDNYINPIKILINLLLGFGIHLRMGVCARKKK